MPECKRESNAMRRAAQWRVRSPAHSRAGSSATYTIPSLRVRMTAKKDGALFLFKWKRAISARRRRQRIGTYVNAVRSRLGSLARVTAQVGIDVVCPGLEDGNRRLQYTGRYSARVPHSTHKRSLHVYGNASFDARRHTICGETVLYIDLLSI